MHCRLLCFPLLVALLFGSGFAEIGENNDSVSAVISRRSLFLGPLLTYDGRNAQIDVQDIQKGVKVPRSGMLGFGLALGMNTPVSPLLRFRIGVYVDFHDALDDTLFTAETVTVHMFYYHAGIEPQLHLAPWHSRKVFPFVLAGAGLNGVWSQERTFLLNDPGQEIIYTDRKYISEVSFSFNVSAGLGCDFALSRRFGISLTDYFRYLYPVSYRIKQDFPLYEMPYRESWLGNIFFLGLSYVLR